MPYRFVLFGANGDDVVYVARLIGDALGIKLFLRESSFKGGDYFFSRSGDGMEISVERHVRDEGGDYAEPEFSDYRILVYVNYARSEAEGEISALSGLRLLRSEVV